MEMFLTHFTEIYIQITNYKMILTKRQKWKGKDWKLL